MVRKELAMILFVLTCLGVQAQSGLNKRQFSKYWQVESESPGYKVTFLGDTCEIMSPKGLTLWRKEKMKKGMTVEYNACVMDEGKTGDRLSDMNAFWMASDPHAKNIWKRANWRSGVFIRCYTLQMYYLGYGGNHNTTTRFRRYDGDETGVDNADKRPAILKEYTDKGHLLKPNHWYHIKIESTTEGRTRFYLDGECIVDYLDPQPLENGWFGFRTTLSRTRITDFKAYDTPHYTINKTDVPLHWIGSASNGPVCLGIPFAEGELKDVSLLNLSDNIPTDTWVNARWADGSVKWAGLAAVVPQGSKGLSVKRIKRKNISALSWVTSTNDQIIVNTGKLIAYLPKKGCSFIDSLYMTDKRIGGSASLIASANNTTYLSQLNKVEIEQSGQVRTVVKMEGIHQDNDRSWLPFTVRLYFYRGSEQIRLVHTFIYNGDEHKDMINSLGIRLNVPMREMVYNRHIAFATDNGIWTEPVQPLDGRRLLMIDNDRKRNLQAEQMEGRRIPDYEAFDEKNRLFQTVATDR